MLNKSKHQQRGFTLIELMISIGLGIAAVSAIMFFYLSAITSSSFTLKKAKLNQELSTVLSIIVQDLRRAGVSQITSVIEEDPTKNPFNSDNYKLSLWELKAGLWSEISLPQDTSVFTSAECITFSYDIDLDSFDPSQGGNAIDGTVENSDLFGYRFYGGSIQSFYASGTQSGRHDCDSSKWEDLIDTNTIKITNLTFEMTDVYCINKSEPDLEDDDGDGFDAGSDDSNGNGTPDDLEDDKNEYDCFEVTPDSGDMLMEVRNVSINLGGELIEDSDVSIQLVEKVKVRNDRFYYEP